MICDDCETQEFPVDWNEWREMWDTWFDENRRYFHDTDVEFPPKNFLADEIIGVWSVNWRAVELSEVTFPDLRPSHRGDITQWARSQQATREWRRHISVTFMRRGETVSGGVVSNFAELREVLGI